MKIAALIAIIFLAAFGILHVTKKKAEQADFFECGDDHELLICETGTTPPDTMMCEAVGDGDTTITPQDCDAL